MMGIVLAYFFIPLFIYIVPIFFLIAYLCTSVNSTWQWPSHKLFLATLLTAHILLFTICVIVLLFFALVMYSNINLWYLSIVQNSKNLKSIISIARLKFFIIIVISNIIIVIIINIILVIVIIIIIIMLYKLNSVRF